jgi:hypothetical protein
VAIVGESSDSLLDSYTVTSGVSRGTVYKFKHRAKNIFGWGPYSDEVSITAATKPDQMAPVSTSIVEGSKVRISWTAPDNRGSPLTSYTVLIQSSAGPFLADSTNCDASVQPLITHCDIPLGHLQDAAFTGLAQGTLVVAKVTATNAFGTSPESDLNVAGARIETVPHQPTSPPTRGAQTHETQIQLQLTALTGDQTGGSAILSYVILWDQGLGGAFAPVVGDTSDNLLTTVVISAGVSSGQTYKFKYLGRNAHGDGPPSDEVAILAATAPATMNPPTVSAISQYTSLTYRVSVTAPHSGGTGVAITSYEIRFKHKDGSGYSSVAECPGTLSDFLTNRYCDVSLDSLTVAPFGLQRGDEVIAQARALNSLGAGAYSADSASGGTALVVTVPATPLAGPYRDEAACTTTSITVNMPLVTGAVATGGLPILSYKLEWAQGAAGSFSALIGDSSPSLATSHTVTGLTPGESYRFRYTVKNEVGWAPSESPVLSTYAAVAPGQMGAPATQVAGLDALITWTAPTNGGLTITGYKVYIRSKDGTFTLETAHCAVATTQCSVPLLTL